MFVVVEATVYRAVLELTDVDTTSSAPVSTVPVRLPTIFVIFPLNSPILVDKVFKPMKNLVLSLVILPFRMSSRVMDTPHCTVFKLSPSKDALVMPGTHAAAPNNKVAIRNIDGQRS